jgi:hypothetical protein
MSAIFFLEKKKKKKQLSQYPAGQTRKKMTAHRLIRDRRQAHAGVQMLFGHLFFIFLVLTFILLQYVYGTMSSYIEELIIEKCNLRTVPSIENILK